MIQKKTVTSGTLFNIRRPVVIAGVVTMPLAWVTRTVDNLTRTGRTCGPVPGGARYGTLRLVSYPPCSPAEQLPLCSNPRPEGGSLTPSGCAPAARCRGRFVRLTFRPPFAATPRCPAPALPERPGPSLRSRHVRCSGSAMCGVDHAPAEKEPRQSDHDAGDVVHGEVPAEVDGRHDGPDQERRHHPRCRPKTVVAHHQQDQA